MSGPEAREICLKRLSDGIEIYSRPKAGNWKKEGIPRVIQFVVFGLS
jgi:hypothetical protein